MLRNNSPVASTASQSPGGGGASNRSGFTHIESAKPLCTSAVATSNMRRSASDRMASARAPAAAGIRINAKPCMNSVLQNRQLVDIHVVEFAADVEDGDPHHEHRHEHVQKDARFHEPRLFTNE